MLTFFFLGAYIGMSVPVVLLGVVTQYMPARVVMLAFVVIVGAAVALSVFGACQHVRDRLEASPR
ncbi:hypothetical protein ACIGW8_34355 [Streptomyces sioyaensis]|uniref:hypothetical protein n=1 Tax=Streptomyces sioyaensis TaxID=67364 RepID=UPI0037D86406